MEKFRHDLWFSGFFVIMAVFIGSILASVSFPVANCYADEKKHDYLTSDELNHRGVFLESFGRHIVGKTDKSCLATLDVCPTAKIIAMNYFMKESDVRKEAILNFKISIRNISDRARRYKLNLSLPEGPCTEMTCPQEGESALLKPGEDKIAILPVYFDRNPQTVTLKVKCQWTLKNAPIMVVEKCAAFVKWILCSLTNKSCPEANQDAARTQRIYCLEAEDGH